MSDPNWHQIAMALGKRVMFALNHLQPPVGSSGTIMNLSGTGEYAEPKYWVDDFADAAELIPGVKVDREVVKAWKYPKRERDALLRKIEKERAQQAKEQAATPAKDGGAA